MFPSSIYLQEENFLPEGFTTAGGPLFSQLLLFQLKRIKLFNPHLFTDKIEDARWILGNYNSLSVLSGYNPAHLVVFQEGTEELAAFDQRGNKIIRFNQHDPTMLHARVIPRLMPFDFDALSDMPKENPSRYNMFTFCVFVKTLSEFEPIFDLWSENANMTGSIYVFYRQSELKDEALIDRIDKFMTVNPNKGVRVINHFSIERSVIYRAFQQCVFSLFLDDSLVYPFWAARMKCYPVVRGTDNFAQYVGHAPTDFAFLALIRSFWKYPNHLADLIMKLNKIQFPKPDFAALLGGICEDFD